MADICSSHPTLFIPYFEVEYLYLLDACVTMILKFHKKLQMMRVKYSDAEWVITFHFYLEDSLIKPFGASIKCP
jgi:hypothetical protein